MATKLCLTLIAALVTLQTTWTFPSGCNVPRYYLPITPQKMRDVWYELAYNGAAGSNRCNKHEFFTSSSDQRGMFTHTLFNGDGTYLRIPYFVNYTQLGYMIYESYPDSRLTSWNFAVQCDCESYLLSTCLANNGVTFAQSYGYISRKRNVSRQVIIIAFTSNNVPHSEVHYINQQGCNN